MYVKSVTYTDYNGVERTEEFRFNLTEAELMEMNLSEGGGMADRVQRMIDAKDVPELIALFKDLLMKSYGEKSADGRRFVKSKEIADAFSQTPAYSKIYMELVTDDVKAAEFINKVVPASVAAAAKEAAEKNNVIAMPAPSAE